MAVEDIGDKPNSIDLSFLLMYIFEKGSYYIFLHALCKIYDIFTGDIDENGNEIVIGLFFFNTFLN